MFYFPFPIWIHFCLGILSHLLHILFYIIIGQTSLTEGQRDFEMVTNISTQVLKSMNDLLHSPAISLIGESSAKATSAARLAWTCISL